MKRIFTAILTLVFPLVMLLGCNGGGGEVVIVMPSGAPALVFAEMMSEVKSIEGKNINYQIVSGTDGILAKINEFDIALMPVNMAAKLHNQGEDITLVSVNILGVLYMVGKEEITDLNQLKGKTVYNIGQGGTPDITLRWLLDDAGIEYTLEEGEFEDKVTLRFVQEGSTLVQMLLKGDAEYGVLGEPVASQALSKGTLVMALDLQEEWQKSTGLEVYPQAGVVAKNSFIKDNPAFTEALISYLSRDISGWIKNNIQRTLAVIEENGGMLPALSGEAVDRSNIGFVSAAEAKNSIEGYLDKIMEFNANAVGGKLPGDYFYYEIAD
jgi:NitT/TauT family transport system substrate-binding protein